MINGAIMPKSGNAARVRRYRAKHKRIDYVPSAAALRIIEHYMAAGLNNCAAGTIDRLVIAGHKAISGNAK